MWFSVHYYYYPIPPLGEWDLVVVWFRVHYYYYYSLPCSKQYPDIADISQSFQAISMKLYGHMRHGRRSSYNDV